SVGPQPSKATAPLTKARLDEISARLSGPESFVYWDSLPQPTDDVFKALGSYTQLAAAAELFLRRIYFALRAKGQNERGRERATFDQIFERLPKAVSECSHNIDRR